MLRFLILLCILMNPLSSLTASEKATGNEIASSAQGRLAEEAPLPDQTIIPGDKPGAVHHEESLRPAAEAYPSQSQKSEVSQSEKNRDGSEINRYDSDPMVTKAVDRNISLFAERIKEKFSLWLSRSGRYLEMMKEILKAKNIPEDIAFLPLIESGFNPSAYSVARAVGPWQFIAGTARRYGLKIDWWRDERKDPVKSTEAAANYLKDLYEMFGSWNLAMAAYNAGEGKILNALRKTKSDDYWALLNTRYIRSETKEYVPRFMAARLIAISPDDYGFEDLKYHSPLEYDEVFLTEPVDLDVAAGCAETTLDTIRELNPELRRWSTPPGVSPYILRVPYGRKESFTERCSKIPEEDRFSISFYTARKGDTIKKISKKTGIPISVILELNDDKGLTLKTGEKIYIPPKEKFSLDRDDRFKLKKASLKNKKTKRKKHTHTKPVVTASNKKSYVND